MPSICRSCLNACQPGSVSAISAVVWNVRAHPTAIARFDCPIIPAQTWAFRFTRFVMKRFANLKRLGFFTRLLDEAPPAERYRLAAEQIARGSGWSRFRVDRTASFSRGRRWPSGAFCVSRLRRRPNLAHPSRHRHRDAAAGKSGRVAEDAAVLDLLSNGRLELGVGTGGNPAAFAAFGLESAERDRIFADNLDVVRTRWRAGRFRRRHALSAAAAIVRPDLAGDVFGERRDGAGKAGDGLLLSRTQPRPRKRRTPRSPRSSIRSSMPISKRCRRVASPGSWRRAASSPPTIVTEALRLAGIGLRRARSTFILGGHAAAGRCVEPT